MNQENNDHFYFLDELFPFTQMQSLCPIIIALCRDDGSASEHEKRSDITTVYQHKDDRNYVSSLRNTSHTHTAVSAPSGWVSLLHSRLTPEIYHVTPGSQSDTAERGFRVCGSKSFS